MPNKSAKLKIESLKRLKSAYILEAKASKTRGWDSAASALFLRAGQLEMELVELFRSQDDEKNARVSLLSAGSCLLQAQQYQTAIETLRQVAEQFPEAREFDRRVRRETKRSLGGNHHGTTGFDRSSCQEEADRRGRMG